jgi:hypothetical protein
MMKLKPVALGTSLGILWGGALFVTTWMCNFSGYGRAFLDGTAGSLYPGYTISPLGSFLGLGYGFIDMFIGGLLVGWIYNKIAGE